MPRNPLRYTLVYALVIPDGLVLVDTGLDDVESWDALVAGVRATGHDITDVKTAVITHLHPDHFGLVPRLRKASGASIVMHAADAHRLRYLDETEYAVTERIDAEQLRWLGSPETVVTAARSADLVRFARTETVDVVVGDGDRIEFPGWDLEVVWTPGHTPGHICLVEHGRSLVFTGDHVLPRVSPNISSIPGYLSNPLGQYLESLDRIANVSAGEALPAHDYRFRGLPERARELIEHHRLRLNEIEKAVSESPRSNAWEITERISWSRPIEAMPDRLRRLAVRETQAHLIVLADQGRAHRAESEPARWVDRSS
ncbi:MBL fold metallo-hydrolase [Rhodococcus sp. ACT016]|uniref:MBL fold metallo-hydrolase n=1 Tax=Rhodococcus sp. ACT016 TaxID=3134808 RepID=UPI003D2968A3